jgi:hypothetical protein
MNTTDLLATLTKLDTNAEMLLPKVIKKSGATVDKKTGDIFEDKRGQILGNIGIPDLIFRLECQRQRENGGLQDEIARARIWFHVAEACAPGDSIPDVGGDDKYLLNAWIVTPSLKFHNPRFDELKKQRVKELTPVASLPQGVPTKPTKRIRASRKIKNMVWAVEPVVVRSNQRFSSL